MTGYLHSEYARSLSEFGTPRELAHSGGWVLERGIPGFDRHDAMGCYPLFACRDWSRLNLDLRELGDDLVCISMVTDPFGAYDEGDLRGCFDRVLPFKDHFVVDLKRFGSDRLSEHHRRYLRKSMANVLVERCEKPAELVDEWGELYDDLVRKHDIKGIATFSKLAFARQLRVPGIEAFRALHDGRTVAMLLCYVQDDVAYYHLGSSSPRGYQLYASYALFSLAIRHLAELGLSWLDLGAGAGIAGDGKDGLTRFKRGWSAQTRKVYFCGRILDQKRYAEIVEARGSGATDYFPAYRKGEF